MVFHGPRSSVWGWNIDMSDENFIPTMDKRTAIPNEPQEFQDQSRVRVKGMKKVEEDMGTDFQ